MNMQSRQQICTAQQWTYGVTGHSLLWYGKDG